VPTSTVEDNKDFTTQAALSGVWARQTNNIVGAQSYYDVTFVTSTTGTIKFIDIIFPPGTLIGKPPRLVEREGIGHGNAVQSSSTTISYTVLNPVSVPAGTKIRLEFFNLVNPTVPSTGYKITVTTRTTGGTVIDGPTASNGLNMKQIGTGQIADNAVTDAKLSADSAYILWSDDTPGNYEVLYKRNTISFDPTVSLGGGGSPAVATSGNNVYVVWSDDTPGNFEILYRRSTDGGATFGAEINLSNTADRSIEPAVAVSGDNVYVVWREGPPIPDEFCCPCNDILYKRSTDGGATFGATFNLTSAATFGHFVSPAIAASGNNVYVVWGQVTPHQGGCCGEDIFYKRSTDGGATFGDTINLSNNGGELGPDSRAPAVAASGNNVYVVWHGEGQGCGCTGLRSTDSGATFATMLSNTGFSPAVAASGNNVYVVWHAFTSGNYEILYRRSTDGGANFGATINLSNNAGNSLGPAVAAINNLPV
jgi:hypothetical protein